MLERFHVPSDIAVRVDVDDMMVTVKDIFVKMGMSDTDAEQSADVLVYADMRGIDSRGVSNMLRRYVQSFNEGGINPKPHVKVVQEMSAAMTIDCDGGHGLVVGPMSMNMAIERAKIYGIGAVTAMNGRHFGACAYHVAMALNHDMIGLAMTSGGLEVAPVDGAKPLVGLNPIGIAVPTHNEPPFIFDASMSSVAGNKIALAKRLGLKVMPGWIARADGTPIMEEEMVPDEFMVLPSGGTREFGAHKGYKPGGNGGDPVRSIGGGRWRTVPAGRRVSPFHCLQHRGVHGPVRVQDADGRVSESPPRVPACARQGTGRLRGPAGARGGSRTSRARHSLSSRGDRLVPRYYIRVERPVAAYEGLSTTWQRSISALNYSPRDSRFMLRTLRYYRTKPERWRRKRGSTGCEVNNEAC